VTAVDSAGNASPQRAALPLTIQAVALEPDPADPTKTALVVGGTTGSDVITLTPADPSGHSVQVSINGVVQPGGPFTPTGPILVYSQGGNDVVQEVAQTINGQRATISVPAILFGGAGNDTLSVAGSSATNVLVGGTGNNLLVGGSGRDILIGGGGASTLQAGSGGDLLIGGSTIYGLNPVALLALAAEWGRTDRSYQQRIGDLSGNSSGGLNGAYVLDSQTVLRDAALSKLCGGTGPDWFWFGDSAQAIDQIFNYANNDVVTLE
jgi:Ca2+-binding RTX toxin-like protein